MNGANNIREMSEDLEYEVLSTFASKSRESRGRARADKECDIRTCYAIDRDRIIHSKAFRRLKDKTQVFLSPSGDHYRTRLTHTLEVSQIARTIAKALRLNIDLTEAIALGHDLGHTPFGHEGEAVLNKECPFGFKHNEQSVRVVDLLEREGRGLNLTWEVRDGILNHRLSGSPSTLEGQVVRMADKLAYLHHDVDDAERAGIITENDIPVTLREMLGTTSRDRLNNLIHDIVYNSIDKGTVSLTPDMNEAMVELRGFLNLNVYSMGIAKSENPKVEKILSQLYRYYIANPHEMTLEYISLMHAGEAKEQVVCDYISGMTDQYAIHVFEEIYIPKSWQVY